MNVKQIIKRLFIGLFVSAALIGITAPISLAQCGGVETAIIKCDQGGGENAEIEDTGLWGVLLIAINILTAGVGVLAVAGVVWASILYSSAGGDAENIKKAKNMIMNIVIGVIAFASMYALLNFIIPGGLFA